MTEAEDAVHKAAAEIPNEMARAARNRRKIE